MNKAQAPIAIAVVVVAAAIVVGWPQPGGLRAWLAEVRDGDADWGWELLGPAAQAAYRNDPAAYAADAARADWAGLDLGPAEDTWSDDGFVHVRAELRSDPAWVPAFLFERRIVHGVCDGHRPVAIGAYEDRRPFQGGAFGGGGLTGGQVGCNAAFTDPGE